MSTTSYSRKDLNKEAGYLLKEHRKETGDKGARLVKWVVVIGEMPCLSAHIKNSDGWCTARHMAI